MRKRPNIGDPTRFHVEPRPDALLDVQLADLQRLASLGVLAGAVLHEINNALTPALSYSQLALASPQDQALTRKALERAVAGIQHATKIAESTLGLAMLSDPGSENPPLSLVAVVVEDAREAVFQLADSAGVRIEVFCPTDLYAAIQPLELQQVIVNLVTNSIRASGRGGEIRIQCSTQNKPGTARVVEIEVVDNGTGVCNRIRGRLFQPLASGAAGGHGLGLMASRRLIEAAGGTLEFDGGHTPGARFVIRLNS